MGERRAADNKKAPPKAKWPVLQPKLNLQITRLKDKDLFTYLPCNQYYTSRYKVGQHFGQHIDESVDLGEGKHTVYTLLVYLSGAAKTKDKSDSNNMKDSASEPIVGGETVFYGSRNRVVAEAIICMYGLLWIAVIDVIVTMQVAPAEGMALLHIHGDKCMLHEARNVSKGIKLNFAQLDSQIDQLPVDFEVVSDPPEF
ncbi:hypothetical protein GOBAR_DD10608 [Gossypium barbadense]|nr:hypothetical protein GOBAR_DD10608 [Gossypium barbadense]